MYAVGGGGDIDQVNGDQDGTAVKPPKPDKGKGKGKVWDKVAWFSKKSKHKYSGNHRSYSSEAHAEPSTSSLSPDGIDIDLSPASTFDSSYPSHIWMDSSSSSDSDLFEMQDGCCVKRSKLYPNSEVIEQNCLKPSVARALFLQLEASNLRNGSESKRSWLKKKKKINYRQNNSCEDSNFEEPVLRGAVSMPGGIKETSNCHCTACCSCSPSRRFNGGCRAYSRRRTSVSSLDTGLTNLDFDFECPGAGSSDMSGTGSEESMLPVSGHVNSLPQGNGDINKSNSLPTYYSQSLQKKCKACGKLIRISHLMCDSNKHVIPNPPFMESLTADFCKCRSQMKEQEGQCTRKVSVPTTSRPANIVPNQELKPKEFKDKFDLMKEWFREFNDEQKNLVLKEMVNQSQVPQIHLLSVEMKHKMHTGCPDNCEDNITWLPRSLSLLIFSYLDPVSLCRASQMSRQWYEMSTESSLWRNFCYQPKWKLSRTGEQKQLINHMMANGDVNWKRVFAEKYKLRNNWLKGKCNVRTFEGHTQGISCVQFDDTRIVSGSSDKTIKVWNIRTNSPWAVQTLVGHSGTVRCLHLDGNRLVSGSTDKTIKVWDLSTQQSWSSIACKVTMIGHLDTVRCLQVDDDKVISGSYDKTLKIWDVRKGVCKQSLRGHDAAVLCVQFDNNKIVSGSCDKTIKIWNFDGDCVMSLTAHHDAVTCLQFDDTRIVSGSLDSTLKFWDVHTGQCLNTIDWKASEGHTGVVRCLQADSWRVVSASDDRTLKVWSLDTCQRLVTLRNHTDGVTCLQFNDSIIVSGSYDKTVKLWDFSCC